MCIAHKVEIPSTPSSKAVGGLLAELVRQVTNGVTRLLGGCGFYN